MATLFNNTEITNAFFNGTELDKIYFNGVLVFEKDGKYKRRIMVGDVFDSNSKIFSDIPDNFINEELPNMGVVDPKQDIITGNIFNVGELYIAGFYRVYIDYKNIPDDGSGYDEQFYVYDVYSYGTMLNNKEVPLDKLNTNDIIVSVNDNITYRHLYIEDPKIRPLQVGDVITENTKFYFTVPDDIDTVITDSSEVDRIIVLDDKSNYVSGVYISNQVCMLALYVSYGSSTIFYEKQNGILDTNLSSAKDSRFVGTVKTINAESKIYPYVLVDITTLG